MCCTAHYFIVAQVVGAVKGSPISAFAAPQRPKYAIVVENTQ
jgi:hypothetical protein